MKFQYIFYGLIGFTTLRMALILLKKNKKNMSNINQNENMNQNTSNEYDNNFYDYDDVIEYSRDKSIALGKRNSFSDEEIFIRPSILKRKGLSEIFEIRREKQKLNRPQYAKAIKNQITLEELTKQENIINKSIRVFIDSIEGNTITAKDNSAVTKLTLANTYDIAGEFVIINLNKEGDKVTENFVIYDN